MRTLAATLVLALAAGCGVGSVLGGGDLPAENPRTVLQLREAATGEVVWEVERRDDEGGTEPLLAGDRVLVASPGGDLTAYDVRDGSVRWEAEGAQLPEAVVDGVAVLDLLDRVEARRLSDGAVSWRVTTTADVVRSRDGKGVVLADHRLGQLGDSTVTRLDPKTGRALWTVTSDRRASAFHGGVSSDVVLVGIAPEGDLGGPDSLRALSLDDGRTLWETSADYIGHVSTSDELPGVVVGLDTSEGKVFDPLSGKVLWSTKLDESPLDGQPFLGGRPGGEGFRRDPRTGERLPGSVPFGFGLGSFGDLLVGADDTTMTAVREATVAWTSDLPTGVRPDTLLDVDARWVVSIIAVGQAVQGD